MFEKKYLEELTDLLCKNELSEIFLKDGDKEISIRKEASIPAPAASVASVSDVTTIPKETINETPVNKGRAITSPMVGTFYKASSPESKPFIEIGSVIKEGQVICIIEAMKLMNEIESEVSGKIIEICVEDGQPVEFGQVLMYVE